MALRARPSPRCSRSRRQAEPRPRSWAHQRARAQPLHKMVRFLFRAREHAPAQPDTRIPSLHHMLHAREAHARAHARTSARLIAFSCAVDRLCIPRTPQVITPRGFGARFGARPSSWAFWILSASAARAGGVNFARIGSSIARFCRGAFWKRHSRVNPWATRGL